MHVQVHYQGMENSPWMDEFITSRVSKLERYLGTAASIQVNLKMFKNRYITSLAIHNRGHDYAFTSDGDNLYESFAIAVDKANRALGEQKRKIKDRINRRYVSLKEAAA